jgi:4-amino-4-deoxy-L-arabinose transferase-like glycosyltransferase
MPRKIVESTIVMLLLVLGLVLRWYKIDNPVGDWHSWRQADTSSVSRTYLKEGVNLLVPRFDDVSNFPSGKMNPMGYRMVEFPLYNVMHLYTYQLLGGFLNFEASGRLLTALLSLVSAFIFYLLVKKLSGFTVALTATFLLIVMPFNIFYSRVILPDQLMIVLAMLANLFLLYYLENKKSSWLYGMGIALGLGMTIRPYIVFYALPLILLLQIEKNFRGFLKFKYLIFVLLSITPFLAWRWWIGQYSEGIPGYNWLFNFSGIRFRPAWFRWLFAERLSKLILGYWGLLPFGIGLLTRSPKKERWIYHLWIVGGLLYFAIFAGGNITHDYYQAILMPMIAIFVAKGLVALWSPRWFIWPISPVVSGFVVFMMLFMSWYQVKEYYNINNWSMVLAGIEADKILPKDAIVVAPYQADTAFLYQINRKGWPAISGDIKTMIDMQKVTHYVSLNYDDLTNKMMQSPEYKILEKNDRFVIMQLRYPNK